ncbi:MAG: hypothetical protein IPH20_14555 [Bacteroidales bacterium]|nr:hypothetical protein [Bacteroidales bacterium]
MRLFLYDKFFEKFIELPRAIQNKVLEFQKKFRENSRSAAIHLEPIKTFIDQSCEQPGLTKSTGQYSGYLNPVMIFSFLWVDTHDEAMAWAQNKMITWNPNTQAVQIFTAPDEKIAPLPVSDTVPSSSLYDYLTDAQLLAIGVPSVSLSLVKEYPKPR